MFISQMAATGAEAKIVQPPSNLRERVKASERSDRYGRGAALGAQLVVPNGSPALEPLSDRERDIMHLPALCFTNQQIGKKLFISVRTVDTHRGHMRKLKLETRAELVMFALANGVIGPNAD
jgi:DNA-binding NarL/FixJ family response regulator